MLTTSTIAAVLFWAVCSPVTAQERTGEEPPAAVSQNERAREGLQPPRKVPGLVVGDKIVLRIRDTAGGLTMQERAQALRMRLGPILTMPNLMAKDVVVTQRTKGGTASIYVRGRLLITVDRNLAKANLSSPLSLANHWALNLQEALPKINVAVALVNP